MTTNLAFTRLQPLHLRLSSFCVQAELYREIIALGGKIRQHVSYCCFNTCIVLAFALPQSRLNSSKNCFPISSLSQSFISDIPQLLKANDSKFMQRLEIKQTSNQQQIQEG